jgi:hypothetical protein
MADWNWALGIQRPAALAAASALAGGVRDREACAAGVAGLPL